MLQGDPALALESLQAVLDARDRVAGSTLDVSLLEDPGAVGEFFGALEQMGAALDGLVAVCSTNEKLRMKLQQARLDHVGKRAADSMEAYLAAVGRYNTTVLRYPGAIIAQLAGYPPLPVPMVPDPAAVRSGADGTDG